MALKKSDVYGSRWKSADELRAGAESRRAAIATRLKQLLEMGGEW